FLAGQDGDAHAAARSADDALASLVRPGIEHDAQAFQSGADLRSHRAVVFADSAGKHQKIESPESRHKAPYGFSRGPGKHLDGQTRSRVLPGFVQPAHVSRNPGNAEQARLRVHDFFHLLRTAAGDAPEI